MHSDLLLKKKGLANLRLFQNDTPTPSRRWNISAEFRKKNGAKKNQPKIDSLVSLCCLLLLLLLLLLCRLVSCVWNLRWNAPSGQRSSTVSSSCASTSPMRNCSSFSTTTCSCWNKKSTSARVSSGPSSISAWTSRPASSSSKRYSVTTWSSSHPKST